MSYGFHKHPAFEIVAAADAELGKPSTGQGKLQCNGTYFQNIGLMPVALDLSVVAPSHLRNALSLPEGVACPGAFDMPAMHRIQQGQSRKPFARR